MKNSTNRFISSADTMTGEIGLSNIEEIAMNQLSNRRSDRIVLEMPIRISGAFSATRDFTFRTRTMLISRYGARILLDHEHVPLSTVCVSSMQSETEKETEARIVGFMGDCPDGPTYGIELLDKEEKFWGIGFPRRDESARAVARVLLQCSKCKSLELTCLDKVEAGIYQVQERMDHHCKNCQQIVEWTRALLQQWPVTSAMLVPKGAQCEIAKGSKKDCLTACIRSTAFGDDLAGVNQLVEAGFYFRSELLYKKDDRVEVALPYYVDSGNVFVMATIVENLGRTAFTGHLYRAKYLMPSAS